MDMDKLKQWMEFAQKVQGGDFWNSVFNGEYGKAFMDDSSFPFENKASTEQTSESKVFPPIDLYQNESHIYIIVEVPGLNKEDLEIYLKGDMLIIKGTLPSNVRNMTKIHEERKYGSFERSIRLPEPANAHTFTARYHNGLLEIQYPRAKQESAVIPID
ncbi:Hsp20/alpha crystallin family protein [Marinicrinis lubricantis]|uniref:Hsp20/alpha crystallin family protein n=1 Tax=Marinicrinis lubricantis TaxID=2086470 RepID=A0ABW1ILE5_9BACL